MHRLPGATPLTNAVSDLHPLLELLLRIIVEEVEEQGPIEEIRDEPDDHLDAPAQLHLPMLIIVFHLHD